MEPPQKLQQTVGMFDDPRNVCQISVSNKYMSLALWSGQYSS